MTDNEHKFLFLLLVRQVQHVKTVVEILKSRGIVTADDLPAFHFAERLDELSRDALARDMAVDYVRAARIAGVLVPPEIRSLAEEKPSP